MEICQGLIYLLRCITMVMGMWNPREKHVGVSHVQQTRFPCQEEVINRTSTGLDD